MPLAKKTSTAPLPDALKAQIESNFKKDSPEISNPVAKMAPKGKYSDSVNLRLTSGKRNEFKIFFAQCEVSMNQGFEAAVDYVIREVRAGRITLSKSGISKTEE